MLDRFNREISYFRISVTDRCNLHCSYCMPTCTTQYISQEEIITIDEIKQIVEAGVSYGITKIRLTGGEPLVRGDIIELVQTISEIKGVEDLAMTTNGVLLKKYASDLKKAGLKRINISLDTLNPEKFKKITKWGNLNNILNGIEAAKNADLNPVKINVVKLPDSSEEELIELKSFCKNNDLELRFIRQMNLAEGEFSEVEGGTGGNCKICNRLRVTADGLIKPCLFSHHEYNIRELGIVTAMKMASENKPECGQSNNKNSFYNIGG